MPKEFKTGCPQCFKALSTPVRAKIIDLLNPDKEKSVTEIVSQFSLTQPTISYHLSELLEAGLLLSRGEGRRVYYRINPRCPYDTQKCFLH